VGHQRAHATDYDDGYSAGYTDGEAAHATDYNDGVAYGESLHVDDYNDGVAYGESLHATDYNDGYAAGVLFADPSCEWSYEVYDGSGCIWGAYLDLSGVDLSGPRSIHAPTPFTGRPFTQSTPNSAPVPTTPQQN
jgi:hypothetical protein